MTPLVCIVILNWNGWKDTVECLESVYRIEYPNYQVLVVDNNSSDDSVSQIVEWARASGLPIVGHRLGDTDQVSSAELPTGKRTLIIKESPENRGYTGGNNLGIQHALKRGADFVLILNNDTVVSSCFLTPLVDAALSDSKVAIVGSVIRHYPQGEIYFAGGTSFLLRNRYQTRVDEKKKYWPSDLVAGSSMLMSRNFLEAESPWLDDRLFLYGEELEICTRARRKGFKVLVAGHSEAFHKVSAALGTGITPAKAYYIYRNKLLLFRELLSPAQRWIFVVAFHAVVSARLAQALLNRNYKVAKAILQAVKDGWRGRGGKWSGQQ